MIVQIRYLKDLQSVLIIGLLQASAIIITLSVFDITTGLLVKRLELGTTPNYIKYSSDGKFLIMERNKKLRFYNTTDWSAEDRMFYNDDSYCMGIDNNDQFVAVGFFNSNAKIYNYQSGSYVQDIPGSFRRHHLVSVNIILIIKN